MLFFGNTSSMSQTPLLAIHPMRIQSCLQQSIIFLTLPSALQCCHVSTLLIETPISRGSSDVTTLSEDFHDTQAKDFTEDLQKRRADSTTEVIGRAEMNSIHSQKALEASQSSARILEVLVECPDRELRMALLSDAFVPPDLHTQEVRQQGDFYSFQYDWQLLHIHEIGLILFRST